MLTDIQTVLEKEIRPQLALHGGDIRLLSVENGVVRFELLGQCSGCPAASITTEELIRVALTRQVPGVTDVVLVERVDVDLLAQGRAILSGKKP